MFELMDIEFCLSQRLLHESDYLFFEIIILCIIIMYYYVLLCIIISK